MHDWEKLDSGSDRDIIAQINPHLTPYQFDPETAILRRRDLAFYEGFKLYELTETGVVPPVKKFALHGAEETIVLDWTNEPIYRAGQTGSLKLNLQSVVPYTKFFFDHVRGEHGRFIIVENVDDIRWREEPPLHARKVIQEMLSPVHVMSSDSDHFYLSAFMLFRDGLFKAKVTVDKNGIISLSDEELKIEGMPVIDDPAAF